MSEKIVQLHKEDQIKKLVRGSVEETLNALLEAEKLIQAARYERNEARRSYRSGHYDRPYHLRRRHTTYPKTKKLPQNFSILRQLLHSIQGMSTVSVTFSTMGISPSPLSRKAEQVYSPPVSSSAKLYSSVLAPVQASRFSMVLATILPFLS